ncbi:MAG: hypothetical protein Q7O66_13520 [Dehalococcoidia bacterium]|nr:hypothetical protein [Dehalococcoidia bacterium]
MTIAMYLCEHVPGAIAGGLRLRNVDVLIAHEDGAGEFDDATLLNRATVLGRVLPQEK